MTPLDGLVMATRSGSVDPGVLLWLQEEKGLTLDALSDGLSLSGGLLGLTGTGDLEEVLVRADEGDDEARLAAAIYVRSLRANIAAMAAALGGVDILPSPGESAKTPPASARRPSQVSRSWESSSTTPPMPEQQGTR